MSFFLRKCWPTRTRSPASSLLLPSRRHTPSGAREACALAGTFLVSRSSLGSNTLNALTLSLRLLRRQIESAAKCTVKERLAQSKAHRQFFKPDLSTPFRTATGRFLKTSRNDKRLAFCSWLAFTVPPVSIFIHDCGALGGSTRCEPSQNCCERGKVSGACERASHLGTTVTIQISRLRRAYATRLFPLLPIVFIGAN
jgi:hypothetical protein